VADTDDDVPLTCDECGREPRPDENADDEWRTYLWEGLGDGVTPCPDCVDRPFGSSASQSR
jgi:hypothetical protein